MNYKLIIGLVVSGVFLFLLYMNYSSVENSIFHPTLLLGPPGHSDTTPFPSDEVTASAALINEMVGKNLLVVDKSTGDIVQLDNDPNDAHTAGDAKTRFDDIIEYIANHTGDHARHTYTNSTVARGIVTSLGSSDGPVAKLNAYKDLIGPGMYTVLGMPRNNDGDQISVRAVDGARVGEGRRAYGAYGILGDMYRYMDPTDDSSRLSWSKAGGWDTGRNRPNGSNTGWLLGPRAGGDDAATKASFGVGSHSTNRNDSSERPWERVTFILNTIENAAHAGYYSTNSDGADNSVHRFNALGDGTNCRGSTNSNTPRPGVYCGGWSGDGGVDRFKPQDDVDETTGERLVPQQPYNDYHLWDNSTLHDRT